MQFDELKSGTKDGSEVTLNLVSNLIGDSNVEIKFPYKLLLTGRQSSRLGKAFANNSSTNIRISKIQLLKITQ